MPFLARFTQKQTSISSEPSTKSRKGSNRRSRGGPPPNIAPRDSSLYSTNFAAAASVSALPLYGVSARHYSSSFALPLSPPRPQTEYHSLAQRNFSCEEVSRVPEHSSSTRQSVWFADQDEVFTPRFAIPSEDFALGGKVTLTRRSPLKTKKWASQSVIGLVKRRMSGLKSREELGYTGEEWPQDSQYPEEQDDMVPPPIPSKSALRAAPSMAVYQLPVDPPNATPSLSSASSDDGETQASPDIRTPATAQLSWGRKKRPESRDPMRIRDGAPTKESSSGVYTPTTFPGAHGPRPSHFPSHVYTPAEYPGPSRSSSMSSSSASASSSDRSSPRTPHSPVSPRWSSLSLSSGFRRISTTFASLDPRSTGWTSPPGAREPAYPFQPPSPDMTRINAGFAVVDPRNTTRDGSAGRQGQAAKGPGGGSYFPPISSPTNFTHSRTTSWAGSAVSAASTGSALGFDVPPSPPVNRARHSIAEVKRKPVPKVDEVQTEIEKLDIDREDSRTPTAAA